MKKIALSIFCFGMMAVSFTSCNDAKNDVIENRVYIQEAVATPINDVLMGDEGTVTTAPITVRLAKSMPNDVKVKLGLDQLTLDSYNEANSTVYEMVPSEYLEFPEEVVLKAGETSFIVPVQITVFKGEPGVDYAIAMAIKSTEGLEALPSTSSFIYALSQPLKQMVPSFQYDNGCRLQPADQDWGELLPNYTVEFWTRVTGRTNPSTGYTINNQALFANGEGEPQNIYVRLGDVVYVDKNNRSIYNFFQIKTGGAQFDSGNPNEGNNGLQPGEWYHWAWTYDAATGTTILYKNGQQISQLVTGTGIEMPMNHINMFDSGLSYFKDNVEMAQLRVWKVTRSASQIAAFMRKEVKYTDPNLLLYIPMNEGEGAEKLADVTGHGHDMLIGQGGTNGTRHTAHAWNEYDFSSL